jgi:hypothetical protein
MNTTCKSEIRELTVDDLDAVNGGWLEAVWNALHPSSGGGYTAPRSNGPVTISNSGNGVNNS